LAWESNIQIVEIDPSEPKYSGIKSAVHFADFIRIEKLLQHGGCWIDSDILFLKNIEREVLGDKNDLVVVSYHNTIATGLIYSTPSNEMITTLYNSALKKIKNKSFYGEYQSLGPHLWADCFLDFPKIFHEARFMEVGSVYPYDWRSLKAFYYEPDLGLLSENTLGVHWYNGNEISRHFLEYALIDQLKPRNKGTPFLSIIDKLRPEIDLDSFLKKINLN
jgi:hypothetical protein